MAWKGGQPPYGRVPEQKRKYRAIAPRQRIESKWPNRQVTRHPKYMLIPEESSSFENTGGSAWLITLTSLHGLWYCWSKTASVYSLDPCWPHDAPAASARRPMLLDLWGFVRQCDIFTLLGIAYCGSWFGLGHRACLCHISMNTCWKRNVFWFGTLTHAAGWQQLRRKGYIWLVEQCIADVMSFIDPKPCCCSYLLAPYSMMPWPCYVVKKATSSKTQKPWTSTLSHPLSH